MTKLEKTFSVFSRQFLTDTRRKLNNVRETVDGKKEEAIKCTIEVWFNEGYLLSQGRKKGDTIIGICSFFFLFPPNDRLTCTGRTKFRDEHINPFLKENGYPPWTSHTPLYKHWFLPEVMREDALCSSVSKPFSFKVAKNVEAMVV